MKKYKSQIALYVVSDILKDSKAIKWLNVNMVRRRG